MSSYPFWCRLPVWLWWGFPELHSHFQSEVSALHAFYRTHTPPSAELKGSYGVTKLCLYTTHKLDEFGQPVNYFFTTVCLYWLAWTSTLLIKILRYGNIYKNSYWSLFYGIFLQPFTPSWSPHGKGKKAFCLWNSARLPSGTSKALVG